MPLECHTINCKLIADHEQNHPERGSESKGSVHPDIPSIMGPACSLPCSSGPFDCVPVDQNKVDIQHLNCFSAPRGGQQIGNLGYDVRGWLCFMCSIWGYTKDVGGQVQQSVWGQADLSAGAAERDKKAKLCCGAPLLTPWLLFPSSAECKDNISFKMSPSGDTSGEEAEAMWADGTVTCMSKRTGQPGSAIAPSS